MITTQTDDSVQARLAHLKSDGIHVSMPELVRFKSLAHMVSLSPSSRAMSQLAGAERSLFKGRGMEFDEARHYQPGDDIRSIDWRVTARTGRTHTKIFREERERPVFLFVDLSPSMQFGTELLFKAVQAAHIAALVAWAAVGRGDKLGGIVFNNYQDVECKPRAQTKNALHFLHSVSKVQNTYIAREFMNTDSTQINDTDKASAESACMSALQRMHFLAKPGSLIHIITDGSQLTESHFALMGDISRHCEIKVSLVQDSFEQSLPHTESVQSLNVTDGERKGSVLLGDADYGKHYEQQHRSRLDFLKNNFAKARIKPRLVSAGVALDKQLVAHKRGFEVGEVI
ncbi:DUF58 domain-containing protein [Ningiella sp. W23]|uniref:DUF58 domain-containing protein n=1 Tax=Ningiella sp. W23 TaxID=3023715 RepID=UPI003756CE3E